VIFCFFFLTVAFDVYNVSVYRDRDKLIQGTIAVTDALASERAWATIVLGTYGRFGNVTFLSRISTVTSNIDKLKKDRDSVHREFDRLDEAINVYQQSEIDEHRQQVLSLEKTGEESLIFYTKLNRYFFDFLLTDSFTNIESSSRRLRTLVRLNLLHEYTSEERGIITFLILNWENRDETAFVNVLRVLTIKQSMREEMELLLEHDDEELYDELRATPQNIEALNHTDRMRQIILDTFNQNDANLTFSEGSWFRNMSTVAGMLDPLHQHIFDKHEDLLQVNLIYFIIAFILAMIGLILEVTACTLLIYLAWPVLKLFWTMEGKAKKVSGSTGSTTGNSTTIPNAIEAMPTPEMTKSVKKHNTFEVEISESIDTELSSRTETETVYTKDGTLSTPLSSMSSATL